MTTLALYNKWRGQTFGDILGQEHITRTLRNQIRAGRIGHAYLFTGLRGTGKTSTARIMAKAVNCIGDVADPPCNQCHICTTITAGTSLDLIEIDAASNRGIDEIRELRERVGFSPHECRYKVYVIDEVHMLTNEAFNALLKTLEEPPSHVIFILCTTEPHRLPDTILSRCQRFDFRRASVQTLSQKLRHICEQEEIAISDEALAYIARRASGSYRDGESLLDQLAAYGAQEISVELVQDVLGSVAWTVVTDIIDSLVAGDTPRGLRAINDAIDGGAEPRQFLSEILDQLRALLLLRVGSAENATQLGPDTLEALEHVSTGRTFATGMLVRAIRLFNEVGQALRNVARPQLPFEMAFIETVLHGQLGEGEAEPAVAEARSETPAAHVREARQATQVSAPPSATIRETPPTPKVASMGPEQVEPPAREPEAAPVTPAVEPPAGEVVAEKPEKARRSRPKPAEEPAAASATAPRQELTLEWVRGNWNRILMKVRPRSGQVHALLNSTFPVAVQGDQVVLGCEASFHRDMLSDAKRQSLVEGICAEVLGLPVQIVCRLEPQVRDLARGASSLPSEAPGDLFQPPQETSPSPGEQGDTGDSKDDPRQDLLNHPVVKALEKRGGQVTEVSLFKDETEK